jgi:capsid protein
MAELNNRLPQIQMGYNGIKNTGRRQAPRQATYSSEDDILAGTDREKLVATTQDQRRNMAVLAWMVRKHLDHVTQFTFQAKTGNAETDKRLEELIAWASRRGNFEVTGRHSRDSYTRLLEGHRVVDGDIFTYFLKSGEVQGIEGGRVATPTDRRSLPPSLRKDNLINGVKIDKNGKALAYAINDRKGGRLVFNRLIPARHIAPLAYYDRFDQVRGISPLSAAINRMQDYEETCEAVRIKEKMHALFGIAITREVQGSDDGWSNTDRSTGNAAGSGTANNDYDFEIRSGMKVEMNPGDKIDTIESKTPSNESQSFMNMMIQVSMLCLDIPISFYDSRKSSYIAKRADILDYCNSIKQKQEGILEVLNRWASWKIAMFIEQGLIDAPQGIDLFKWEFVAKGSPVLDKQKENQADLQAIAGGLTSHQRVAKERGVDAMEILDEMSEYQQRAKELQVQVQLGDPGANFLGIVNGQLLDDLEDIDPGEEDADADNENTQDDE